jgi:hypothetical protein
MVLLCGAIFSEIENEKKHFYSITVCAKVVASYSPDHR